MTTYIHINQHKIRSNHKSGDREPVITVKEGRSNTYCDEVDILDLAGNIVATVKYKPDNPLPCGARCWVEAYAGVTRIREA